MARGNFIQNIVDKMLNLNDEYYAIEHKNKKGWFLFDVDKTETRTECVWIADKDICLLWADENAVKKFIKEQDMEDNVINIVKLSYENE